MTRTSASQPTTTTKARVSIVALLLWAGLACTKPNDQYCIRTPDCAEGRWCDTDRRTCMPLGDGSIDAKGADGNYRGAEKHQFSGGDNGQDATKNTDSGTAIDTVRHDAKPSIDTSLDTGMVEEAAVPPPDTSTCVPAECDDGKPCTWDTCGDSGECERSIKSGYCLIDETCFTDAEERKGNPCQICDAAENSNTSWTWRRGCVFTLAGTGSPGHADGSAATARFDEPSAVAVDEQGRVYVSEFGNRRVRLIEDGQVSTIAGTGDSGYQDSPPAAEAWFKRPAALLLAGQTIYVADDVDNRIRVIQDTEVQTLAGNGNQAFTQGSFSTAEFFRPESLAWLSPNKMLVGESTGVRLLDLETQTVSQFAGINSAGFEDGDKLSKAEFMAAAGLAVDSLGTVYVADHQNNRIRAIVGNAVTTIAGTGQPGFTDGAALTKAQFDFPMDVARIDDRLYVVDRNNNAIRVIHGSQVSTLVGGPADHEDGPLEVARFSRPMRMAVGNNGWIYLADRGNHRIRVIILP
jgi:DNA-binding beta-propeller fold protein YncE